MPNQTKTGKAFEYALLQVLESSLTEHTNLEVKKDNPHRNALRCYKQFSHKSQEEYNKAATLAVQQLQELEPHLIHGVSDNDKLQLRVVADQEEQTGDVRNIIAIRKENNWEIGISSATNHHKTVKHSHLSANIDFGNKWIGIPCSKEYFTDVSPIFDELTELSEKNSKWKDINDKHDRYYIPILKAFRNELLQLDRNNPGIVSTRLFPYLIGNKDFYKVIKNQKQTIIQGFNLYGTFNKQAGKIKSKFNVPQLKLPNRIIEFDFKQNSSTTMILTFDRGWQMSFRIHSASTRVENSLKFDIQLEGQPPSLYIHNIYWA